MGSVRGVLRYLPRYHVVMEDAAALVRCASRGSDEVRGDRARGVCAVRAVARGKERVVVCGLWREKREAEPDEERDEPAGESVTGHGEVRGDPATDGRIGCGGLELDGEGVWRV